MSHRFIDDVDDVLIFRFKMGNSPLPSFFSALVWYTLQQFMDADPWDRLSDQIQAIG